MAFSHSVYQISGTYPQLIPVGPQRPGRNSLEMQILGYDPGVPEQFWSPLIGVYRYLQADYLDQEFYVSFDLLTNGDVVVELVTDQQLGVSGPDKIHAGIYYDVYFTPALPTVLTIWEAWPDPPSLEGPKCNDGTLAEVLVNHWDGSVIVRECRKPKPIPIVSLDVVLKRLKGRGLLNV
jgi:hypothetical protein